jgi:putative pyruvate formate lyase activating enzyme
VTKREYEAVIAYTLSLGMENVFIQEGETAKESVIPKFDEKGILERHSLTEPSNFTS